ncbi:hypothetical protein SLAV_38720 [Streptomyces lavendulae subsp. lavendulae]|uniref:Uncharacterized protein n=1 Tax=Streptomyces lavendulae subsp. lavendulae TaxID=58340 RepID=A0A2K8PRY9_STRLA|nr:hypothetical protein [Streptomyces lavendulae]ATZ22064.1 hypothetical protein SLAV_00670 [Streptomyces lavendulae subsp. lavendulae]ATZ29507.1 hypothetical protein SLAV_38720 [Streptomyces lavendulae subsp. lavendulae]
MTRNTLQEDMDGLQRHDPDDMWHALTRLHASHPEPPDRILPHLTPDVLLSLTRSDLLWRVRVELAGGETMADLYNLVANLIPAALETDERRALPGETLEIVVGTRDELTLHPAHVHGLTQLLRDAVTTIDAHSTPGRGLCSHCHGTGRGHPLWAPAAGQA